ncbi:LysR family transcriptional regulator [Phenylobacterium sp. LjRoot219]|uniref:LysR family transcriptional regulator n=1 Tax=Phenylobacterium sp. LjRoot219 TaxID=3342283 RepID=UPI003ECC74A1
MELRPLRHVAALARHLNYKKAADELGLTQPALSRSIQVTEERYGARLFDRNRGGVHLTAVGRLFVDRAEILIREAADFERTVHRYAGAEEGLVAFGVSPSAARACLPRLLRELAAERPALNVSVAVRRTSALVPLLMSEDIEFLVCPKNDIAPNPGLKSEPLGSFSACLLVRAGHPILSDDTLKVSEFPIITTGPFQGADKTRGGLVGLYDLQPRITVESTEALAKVAVDSDAIWMSSTMSAADELASGELVRLDRRDGREAHRFEVMIYSLRERTFSPASKDIGGRLRRILGQVGSES